MPRHPPRPGSDLTANRDASPHLTTLVVRSARGDRTAFAQLYDAAAPRVHGLALRVLRDPERAEQVTEATFLEVWRTAVGFDASRGSALAWILAVGHRLAVDLARAGERADPGPCEHQDELETAYFDGRTHAEVARLHALGNGAGTGALRDQLLALRALPE